MESPHILIVEDEVVTRDTLRSTFEAERYVVTEAKDSAEMHKAMQENNIDLVVMDINIPGKDELFWHANLVRQTT